MNVVRYVNGVKIDANELKNIEIESDVVTKTIRAVNRRLRK